VVSGWYDFGSTGFFVNSSLHSNLPTALWSKVVKEANIRPE
jgi:hypothetical protein